MRWLNCSGLNWSDVKEAWSGKKKSWNQSNKTQWNRLKQWERSGMQWTGSRRRKWNWKGKECWVCTSFRIFFKQGILTIMLYLHYPRISDTEFRITDLKTRISNVGFRISNIQSDLESWTSNFGSQIFTNLHRSRILNLGSRICPLSSAVWYIYDSIRVFIPSW